MSDEKKDTDIFKNKGTMKYSFRERIFNCAFRCPIGQWFKCWPVNQVLSASVS